MPRPRLLDRVLRACERLVRIHGRLEQQGDWYEQAEAEYPRLFALIRSADRCLWPRLLVDGRIPTMLPPLHELRAAFEFRAELDLAASLAGKPSNLTSVSRRIEQDRYWAASPILIRAVEGSDNVLLAGAGAFPSTAFGIAASCARICCLEIDEEACALGERVVRRLGYGKSIRYLRSDLLDFGSFEAFDCIVVPALLGVAHRGVPDLAGKAETLARIVGRLPAGARLVVRDPRGLSTLLYPSADIDWPAAFDVARREHDSGPGKPNLSDIVVAIRK